MSCRHWKDVSTAAIAAANTAADETAMIYMRGSKGSCQSGQPRTAAANRARREREGPSIPVSTCHLDRRVMIAACGAPVSHSDRAAVYARRVPISTPGHIHEDTAHPKDNQYIYDAGPGSSRPRCEARHSRGRC